MPPGYSSIFKNMVIFTIGYCHGNSLQCTHMTEKETGVLPKFTENFRGLNPKVKQIDHF